MQLHYFVIIIVSIVAVTINIYVVTVNICDN